MTRAWRYVAVAFFALGIQASEPAYAQTPYPNTAVKLVVPYAAGGVPDTTARLLAQKLQERIDQTVVVENRAGANGVVAVASEV